MKQLSIALALSLCAAALSAAPASARVMPGADARPAKAAPSYAGYVGQNGTIMAGHGFTVQHTGTGTYTITYPSSDFPNWPAMVLSGFGYNGSVPIVVLSALGCNATSCTFDVGTFSANGTPNDNSFDFVIVQAK